MLDLVTEDEPCHKSSCFKCAYDKLYNQRLQQCVFVRKVVLQVSQFSAVEGEGKLKGNYSQLRDPCHETNDERYKNPFSLHAMSSVLVSQLFFHFRCFYFKFFFKLSVETSTIGNANPCNACEFISGCLLLIPGFNAKG